MLFVFIIGLLLRLSAVQGSTSSYLPEIPPRNSNLASTEQNSANEVSLPFDGISPRFWFGQGYRQAFKQIIQFYNDQLLMDKGSDSGKVASFTFIYRINSTVKSSFYLVKLMVLRSS